MPLWPVTAPSVARRAVLVGEQLLDALLGLGGDLVGPLVVASAVLDQQLANFFALLVLEVVDGELGVEPPLGPFDEVLAQEALPLAAGAAGREAIQAGQHRVLRLALVVGGDGPLVGQLDELRRLELADFVRRDLDAELVVQPGARRPHAVVGLQVAGARRRDRSASIASWASFDQLFATDSRGRSS